LLKIVWKATTVFESNSRESYWNRESHFEIFADETKVFGNINHVSDSKNLQEDLNKLLNRSQD